MYVSHRTEAALKSLIYWHKLQGMEDTRLPKKCYLFQLAEIQNGVACWASPIEKLLDETQLHDMWLNRQEDIRTFQPRCIENLVAIVFEKKLRVRASQYTTLKILRVVKELTGRSALIVCPMIQADPEKHRWIIMTLLSCPGSLVKRSEDGIICSGCAEVVEDIFYHIITSCRKISQKIQQNQVLVHLRSCLLTDPESAVPTLIYYLFMSEFRFRLQLEYLELFSWLRDS